jgi:hypothetical protein
MHRPKTKLNADSIQRYDFGKNISMSRFQNYGRGEREENGRGERVPPFLFALANGEAYLP